MNPKKNRNYIFLLRSFVFIIAFLILSACSDTDSDSDSNWCPGTVCTNCATDCPTLSCSAGQTNACVSGTYFDADASQRCSFCQ